jgi:hypothetical protein
MKIVPLLLTFFFIAFSANAQDVQVLVESRPASQVSVSSPWTLTFIVDYPAAEEVSIVSPALPDSFSFVRLLKNTRFINGKVLTVFEYTYLPAKSGYFALGAFRIVTPNGTTETNAINMLVTGDSTLPEIYRCVWEIQPEISGEIEAGERAELILRLPGWTAANPPPSFFMPDVSQDIILSRLPLPQNEREAGILIKLNLIPVDADFRMDAKILQYENAVFQIPALHIRVKNRALHPDKSGAVEIPAEIRADPLQNIQLEDLEKDRRQRLFFGFACITLFLVIFTLLICLFLYEKQRNGNMAAKQ